jgi:hypothetical protein
MRGFHDLAPTVRDWILRIGECGPILSHRGLRVRNNFFAKVDVPSCQDIHLRVELKMI